MMLDQIIISQAIDTYAYLYGYKGLSANDEFP